MISYEGIKQSPNHLTEVMTAKITLFLFYELQLSPVQRIHSQDILAETVEPASVQEYSLMKVEFIFYNFQRNMFSVNEF